MAFYSRLGCLCFPEDKGTPCIAGFLCSACSRVAAMKSVEWHISSSFMVGV